MPEILSSLMKQPFCHELRLTPVMPDLLSEAMKLQPSASVVLM
jgi:hypothetical protein